MRKTLLILKVNEDSSMEDEDGTGQTEGRIPLSPIEDLKSEEIMDTT